MAEWFYSQNQQPLGPISWDELRQLAATGILKPTDLIWKEGMIDWLKAGKKDDLFSTRQDGFGAEPSETPRRRPRQRDADDFDDRPRRRRPRGMPLGVKVAIIGGSIALGLLVLVIVIVLLVGGTSTATFRVLLMPGQEHSQDFMFNAGQNVRITVRSQTGPRTDVDLFVSRANGELVALDRRVSKDCYVQFVAPNTELYRVRIVNLANGHGNAATCDVYLR